MFHYRFIAARHVLSQFHNCKLLLVACRGNLPAAHPWHIWQGRLNYLYCNRPVHVLSQGIAPWISRTGLFYLEWGPSRFFFNLFRECQGLLVLLAKCWFTPLPYTFFNKSDILMRLPWVRDCPPFLGGILAEMPWAGLKRGVFYFLKSQGHSSGIAHS